MTTCKSFFHSIYKCFSNFTGHNYSKCFERKLWNRDFGTEIPIPNISFEKTLIIHQFYIHAIADVLIFFYTYFFKTNCEIGFSVPKPLIQTFPSKQCISCRRHSYYPRFLSCLFLPKKLWNMGFSTETPILRHFWNK